MKNTGEYFIPYLKSLLVSGFLFLAVLPGLAQTRKDHLISISAENEKLGSFLIRLSKFDHVNISFNASDSSFNQRINYLTTNKPLEKIFQEILPLTNHDYRQVGNHWVVFASEENSDKFPTAYSIGTPNTKESDNMTGEISAQDKTVTAPDTIIKYIEIPVPFTDTVFVENLITTTDTIILRDTVFIEPSEATQRKTQTVKDLKNVFRAAPDRENGWAISFSYAQMVAGYNYSGNPEGNSKTDELKESEPVSFRNFSLGTSIRYNLKKFRFNAGLKLTGFSHKFSYQDVTATGGFFDVDTLDVYYTVVQSDTTYIFVTDSSWVPLEQTTQTYDRLNQIGLLEFHIGADYKFYSNNDLSFNASVGFDAGIPVWVNGSTILDTDGFPSEELTKDLFSKTTQAWTAGLGGSYKITNWSDLFGEVFYKHYLNEFVETYPLERRMYGFGLRVGLLYYL